MISFMVLGGPRSATTWLANLLTTDSTLCLHDPLLEHKAHLLDQMTIPGKRLGMADTSAMIWPEWVWPHPAKKIILYRNPDEMNTALRALGLREIEPANYAKWIKAAPRGVEVISWETVFDASMARRICRKFDIPFCRWRFEELRKMNIQPQFTRLPLGKEAVQELVQRLAKEVA